MTQPQIQPPPSAPPDPDKFTKKNMDLTGGSADGRVLRIGFGFMQFGTDDKVGGAAMFLCVLLGLLVLVVGIAGLWAENTAFAEKVFGWGGSAFLFVAGVATGRQTKGGDD